MMLKEPVSDSVVRRLPRYYRYLSELERAGVERTSSQALATQLDCITNSSGFKLFWRIRTSGLWLSCIRLTDTIGQNHRTGTVYAGGFNWSWSFGQRDCRQH